MTVWRRTNLKACSQSSALGKRFAWSSDFSKNWFSRSTPINGDTDSPPIIVRLIPPPQKSILFVQNCRNGISNTIVSRKTALSLARRWRKSVKMLKIQVIKRQIGRCVVFFSYFLAHYSYYIGAFSYMFWESLPYYIFQIKQNLGRTKLLDQFPVSMIYRSILLPYFLH